MQTEWITINKLPDKEEVDNLICLGEIPQLSINPQNGKRLLVAKRARYLAQLIAVQHLHLWLDVSRASLAYVLKIPRLHTLDVLCMRERENLYGFQNAEHLKIFRVACGLEARDIDAVIQSKTIERLGLQSSCISVMAAEKLAYMPSLKHLDLEGANFNNAMAEKISESLHIETLELGATQITKKGLKHLTKLRQLKGLDLWATQIDIQDIEILSDFQNLEYFSFGGMNADELNDAESQRLVELLFKIPKLKRVWLDGVHLSDKLQEQFGERGIKLEF